jgi:hypothetical protein
MNYLLFIILLNCLSKIYAQDTSTYFKIETNKDDLIKGQNKRDYEKIYMLKVNKCNFEELNTLNSRYNLKISAKKKIVTSGKMELREISIVPSSIVDTWINKKSYIVYRKDSSSNFSKDSLRISLVRYKNFYFAYDRLSYEEIKATLDKQGYHPYRIELFTYSSFWNKFLNKFGLIKDMNYYERLKCIDFDELAKKLD